MSNILDLCDEHRAMILALSKELGCDPDPETIVGAVQQLKEDYQSDKLRLDTVDSLRVHPWGWKVEGYRSEASTARLPYGLYLTEAKGYSTIRTAIDHYLQSIAVSKEKIDSLK